MLSPESLPSFELQKLNFGGQHFPVKVLFYNCQIELMAKCKIATSNGGTCVCGLCVVCVCV